MPVKNYQYVKFEFHLPSVRPYIPYFRAYNPRHNCENFRGEVEVRVICEVFPCSFTAMRVRPWSPYSSNSAQFDQLVNGVPIKTVLSDAVWGNSKCELFGKAYLLCSWDSVPLIVGYCQLLYCPKVQFLRSEISEIWNICTRNHQIVLQVQHNSRSVKALALLRRCGTFPFLYASFFATCINSYKKFPFWAF